MTTSTDHLPAPPPLRDLLHGELTLGDPDVAGSLTVFPIVGPEPKLEYTSFADGRAHGATITELAGGASVRDLVVDNPTPLPLLLFEGEEVLGAQQNRTLDVTVLVAAGAKTSIPVSCVEQGRWDGRRHGEVFERAPQAAYPELRLAKSRQARGSLRAGGEARADQSRVWSDVDAKAMRHGVRSQTGAMHDVYESHRGRLNEMNAAVKVRADQVGALVAIGDRISVLDLVSSASVFTDLHAALVQGYALDALEIQARPRVSRGEAEGFLELAFDNHVERRPGIGLGEDLRFDGNGSEGSGLAADGELVQLTAFRSTGEDERVDPRPPRRIRRPSQRNR